MNYGTITETVHVGPLGKEVVTFGWQGGPYLQITNQVIRRGDPAYVREDAKFITIGPYRLRKLEYDPLVGMGGWVCVRDGWRWLPYANWYRLTHLGERTYRRLILTAAVWGLAEFHEYNVPSWRDLHIVRWWNAKPTKARRAA